MAKTKDTQDAEDVKDIKTEKPKTKKSKGWLFALLGSIAFIGILVAGFLLLKSAPAPDDPKAKLSYSSSFFIYDNSHYTLWNADGKRLTEDTYEAKSDFIAGYAYVKKDGQAGIIRDDGTMTVPFGKYGQIEARGGLFLAQDGNTKQYHVLTGTGKDLMMGDDLTIDSSGSTSAFAVIKSTGAYDLFTYSGAHLGTFLANDGDDAPELSTHSDFGLFYFNNLNLVFDVRTSQVLASIDGSKYSFEGVTENRSQILLQNEEDESTYILIAGNNVITLDECKYYAFTILDYLIGYESYDEIAILNPDYTVAKRVNSYLALKDQKNYAVKNDDGNVDIVKDGQVVKTFDKDADLESGVLYDDLYAITNDGKTMFYHLDGSVAINHEFKSVWSLFDKFHHAAVADEEDEYYLIDTAGNRLTEGTYKRIYTEDGGYELKNADDKYAIANEKGEVQTDAKYESLYYRSAAVGHNIWTGRNDTNDYDVLDIANKKILLEHVNVNSFYANYFTIKNADGKYEYYTYSGLKFYTSES